MRIHGHTLLAGRLTSGYIRGLAAVRERIGPLQPITTALNGMRSGAHWGGVAGIEVAQCAPSAFPVAGAYLHFANPASARWLGQARFASLGVTLPVVPLVWGAGLLLGTGKSPQGIKNDGGRIFSAVNQYGVLGLPEFTFAAAAAKARAKGHAGAAAALSGASWLLAAALEVPRLVVCIAASLLSAALGLATGVAVGVVGVCVGGLFGATGGPSPAPFGADAARRGGGAPAPPATAPSEDKREAEAGRAPRAQAAGPAPRTPYAGSAPRAAERPAADFGWYPPKATPRSADNLFDELFGKTFAPMYSAEPGSWRRAGAAANENIEPLFRHFTFSSNATPPPRRASPTPPPRQTYEPPPRRPAPAPTPPAPAPRLSPPPGVARWEELSRHLCGQKTVEQTAQALRDVARVPATLAASLEALDAQRNRLAQARTFGSIDHALGLLREVVGPLAKVSDFRSAFKMRSLLLHPDKLSAQKLDAPSMELARHVWDVLGAARELAEAKG